MVRGCLTIAVGVLLAFCAPASGQPQSTEESPPTTRAEVLRRAREARALADHKPNPAERAFSLAEGHLMPLLLRDGIHWKLGSLTTGSGFAYGAGYRNRRLFDREGAFTVWAAGSLKQYRAVEARLEFPNLAGGKLSAGGYGRYHSYPQEAFFGIGPDSSAADWSTFRMTNTFFGAYGGVRPWRSTLFGAAVDVLAPRIGPGTTDNVPPIDSLFNENTAPGLEGEHNFTRTAGFVDVDYRYPKYPRRGGRYRFDVSHYWDRTGTFDFVRVDADLRQFISAFAERRVVALRLFASTSEPISGGQIPFYLMPWLGGQDTLRGHLDYRFRGAHAMLAQAEYRWEIWSGLDAALFYDTGKVADRRADLNFRDLNNVYGFGFRFNTDNGVIARVDVGFGSGEGTRVFIVFGDVF